MNDKVALSDGEAAKLAALLKYAKSKGWCPMPQQWDALWQMLPERKGVGSNREPAVPLILGGWHDTAPQSKTRRFQEHIEWAATQGVLDAVDLFLRGLSDEQWYRGEGHRSESVSKFPTDAARVVLQVGAEGGDVTLIGRRTSRDAWQFTRITDEQTEALFGETDIEIQAPPALESLEWEDNWDAALAFLDRHEWARLHPLHVHPDFVERVRVAVDERLALMPQDRWTEHARGKWERVLRRS